MPPKGGDKGNQFWSSIISQKQDTIRWCFNYGGITPFTRDDDGYCGIHVAAKNGKVRSLESILDHIRRMIMGRGGGDIRGTSKGKPRVYEELEVKDEDVGLTAFMWACRNGHYECAVLLYENGVCTTTLSDERKVALDYAKQFKHEAIVKWFERGFQEEEEEDDGQDEVEFIEGETASERRKRIKAMKMEKEKFSGIAKKEESGKKGIDEGDEEEEEEELNLNPDDAKWPEIKECIASKHCELVCLKQQGKETDIDPLLWQCRHINNLKLRMPAKSLTELPSDLAKLKNLTTLIVSHNSLTRLPPEIERLVSLKNLEFTDNNVNELPAGIESLQMLEVFDACRNSITSITPLSALHNLVTLKLDQNKIDSLSPLAYKKLTRLATLSASYNEIDDLDEKIGRLGALTSLNLSNNKIKELPVEMSDFSEKVLLHLNLDENPLKDSKARKILEKGRAPIKELLAHLQKERESGRGKKKNKSKQVGG